MTIEYELLLSLEMLDLMDQMEPQHRECTRMQLHQLYSFCLAIKTEASTRRASNFARARLTVLRLEVEIAW